MINEYFCFCADSFTVEFFVTACDTFTKLLCAHFFSVTQKMAKLAGRSSQSRKVIKYQSSCAELCPTRASCTLAEHSLISTVLLFIPSCWHNRSVVPASVSKLR